MSHFKNKHKSQSQEELSSEFNKLAYEIGIATIEIDRVATSLASERESLDHKVKAAREIIKMGNELIKSKKLEIKTEDIKEVDLSVPETETQAATS